MVTVDVRKFNNTNIADMTLYIEKHYCEIFPQKVREWIEDEVKHLPFDDYAKQTMRGALMRSCLLSQKITSEVWNNQMLVLE